MSDIITLAVLRTDVLLIGGGAIGQVVLRETLGDLRLRITHVLDVPQVRERLQQTVGPDIQVISSLDELAAVAGGLPTVERFPAEYSRAMQ